MPSGGELNAGEYTTIRGTRKNGYGIPNLRTTQLNLSEVKNAGVGSSRLRVLSSKQKVLRLLAVKKAH